MTSRCHGKIKKTTYPEVHPKVWLEAVVSNKKGQILGMGHNLDIGIRDSKLVSSLEPTSLSHARPMTQTNVIDAINAAMLTIMNAMLSSFV